MKSVTIRELTSISSGSFVHRLTRIFTERGQVVAVLKSAKAADLVGKPFPKRDISKMPRSNIDSRSYVSQDRAGR
jgi:hypothetical protein